MRAPKNNGGAGKKEFNNTGVRNAPSRSNNVGPVNRKRWRKPDPESTPHNPIPTLSPKTTRSMSKEVFDGRGFDRGSVQWKNMFPPSIMKETHIIIYVETPIIVSETTSNLVRLKPVNTIYYLAPSVSAPYNKSLVSVILDSNFPIPWWRGRGEGEAKEGGGFFREGNEHLLRNLTPHSQ